MKRCFRQRFCKNISHSILFRRMN